LLERVEVLRRPASVLHGVGAIGGAINYVPRSPLRHTRVTDVLFAAGRYDTYQLDFNTSGPISDRLAYQIGAISTRSDGYVDDGDSRRLSTASSLVFDVTPEFTLRLAFDGSWNEPLRYFGTPLNNGAIDTRLRDRNYNVSDSLMRWEDYWVRLHAEWRLATAQQYEIGLKTQFLGGRSEATVAGYYIVKEDLLSTDPTNPDVTLQIGQQSSYGVELAVGLTPLPQLTIDANMALLDAQFDDFTEAGDVGLVSHDGNQPPDVPELLANLWVVYTPVPAWSLGAGFQYVGERFADNANTVSEPSYTLVDALVSYTPWRFANFTLRGRNLTDETYAIAAYGPRS
jgi:outer membrane receptor protein involved in Fe transport